MELKNIVRDLRHLISNTEFERTRNLVNFLLENEELKAVMRATNVIVVNYLKYNDHGWSHAVITTRNALRILTIIRDKIPPNIVKHGFGSFDDAAFVTALAAFLHDIGNMVHRDYHWSHSLWISKDLIWNIINERVQAFTVEASAVKVGDGCDMAAGRSRKPYNIGKVDIHSVSALSITEVEITKGSNKPLKIIVNMTSPAGIFQVEDVLLPKIRTSLLNDKIEIVTLVNGKKLRLSKSPL